MICTIYKMEFFSPQVIRGSHLNTHYVNKKYKQESNYTFMKDGHTLKNALDNKEDYWSLVWQKRHNGLNNLISHTFLDLANMKDFTEMITKQNEIILANILLSTKQILIIKSCV